MRIYFMRLGICLFFLGLSIPTFAEGVAQPVINNNVHIMTNVSPDQCPTSWRGSLSPEAATDMSGYGIDTGIETVGVQSCSNCAFDKASGDCVCGTCYGYYN